MKIVGGRLTQANRQAQTAIDAHAALTPSAIRCRWIARFGASTDNLVISVAPLGYGEVGSHKDDDMTAARTMSWPLCASTTISDGAASFAKGWQG
jgi:hypothetical protein